MNRPEPTPARKTRRLFRADKATALRWLFLGAVLGIGFFSFRLPAVSQRLGLKNESKTEVNQQEKTIEQQTELPGAELRLRAQAASIELTQGMVRIPAGTFQMGAEHTPHTDQRPIHEVKISEFYLDQNLVTNADFTRFVQATHYITTAEQRGDSFVFQPSLREWARVKGACWRSPKGAGSLLTLRELYPVVHVSHLDAVAYAKWAKKRLLTEAEYEYAARGGLFDCDYPWGRVRHVGKHPTANFWDGQFPRRDLGLDGFAGLAPVGSFPPNRFGIYDMAGNVWCWCADWYSDDYYGSALKNPTGPLVGDLYRRTERPNHFGLLKETPEKPQEVLAKSTGVIVLAAAVDEVSSSTKNASLKKSEQPTHLSPKKFSTWYADWYGDLYHYRVTGEKMKEPLATPMRVLRGGSWLTPANEYLGQRVAYRNQAFAEQTNNQTGFRCARDTVPGG